MFSWLKPKRRAHLYADAAPATSTTVAEVSDATLSLNGQQFDSPNTIAKQGAELPPGKVLKLRSTVCYLPHPDKVHYGGEDAHFISEVGGGALGVADGVGGWQESGVNPADYSRMLMKMSCAYLEGRDIFENESQHRLPGPFIDPKGALHAAHSTTKVPGSATACVMQLDQANGTLEAANLGDSGFVVIRQGRVLVKSKPLQHYFDCPLQFGAFPEFVEATDTADMADCYSIPLQPGDVVIAGSDGLWDNTFDHEVIARVPRTPAEVQKAADSIGALAREHAGDGEFPSPYTREALSQGLDLPWWEKLIGASFKNGRLQMKQLTGGKMDDITVLVALVDVDDAPPPPSPQHEDGGAGAGQPEMNGSASHN